MKFENILLPTDGSEATKSAVEAGIALAKKCNGAITALYVLDQSVYSTMPMDAAVVNVYASLEKEGCGATGYVTALAKDQKVEVNEKLIEGIPANVIDRISMDYDLIVMGTVGRSGMSKALMGSVAEKVIIESQCPVMVVKHNGNTLPVDNARGKILVPTDGGKSTEKAIDCAIAMAAVCNCGITALYVKGKKGEEKAATAVKEVETKCEAAGIAHDSSILEGSPAEVIIGESSKYNAIVMGTEGRKGMSKALKASVAGKVIKDAKCLVLVAKNR